MKRLRILWRILRVTGFTKFICSFIAYLFVAALILLYVEPRMHNFEDSLWYCFVSSTTLGYGDIVVKTGLGRLVSVVLALFRLFIRYCRDLLHRG